MRIYPKDTMFLRSAVGEITGPDGASYELTTHFSGGNPLVRSRRTGKFFSLSWWDVVRMAVEQGIDDETEDAPEKEVK